MSNYQLNFKKDESGNMIATVGLYAQNPHTCLLNWRDHASLKQIWNNYRGAPHQIAQIISKISKITEKKEIRKPDDVDKLMGKVLSLVSTVSLLNCNGTREERMIDEVERCITFGCYNNRCTAIMAADDDLVVNMAFTISLEDYKELKRIWDKCLREKAFDPTAPDRVIVKAEELGIKPDNEPAEDAFDAITEYLERFGSHYGMDVEGFDYGYSEDSQEFLIYNIIWDKIDQDAEPEEIHDAFTKIQLYTKKEDREQMYLDNTGKILKDQSEFWGWIENLDPQKLIDLAAGIKAKDENGCQTIGYVNCGEAGIKTAEEYSEWIRDLLRVYMIEPEDLTAKELQFLKEGGYIDEE